MWNSSSPAIRRLFLFAMDSAGLTEPFLALSHTYLEEHDDPEMLRRRTRRLEELMT